MQTPSRQRVAEHLLQSMPMTQDELVTKLHTHLEDFLGHSASAHGIKEVRTRVVELVEELGHRHKARVPLVNAHRDFIEEKRMLITFRDPETLDAIDPAKLRTWMFEGKKQ